MKTLGRKDDYRKLLSLSEFTTLCRLSEYLCQAQRHSLKKLFCLAEKNILLNVLHRVNGNQRDAGRILGLKSTTLNAKLKKYGIRVVKQIGIDSLPHDRPAR
jgi:DNA-binding protein Fis